MPTRQIPDRWMLSQLELGDASIILRDIRRRFSENDPDEASIAFRALLATTAEAIEAASKFTLKRAGTVAADAGDLEFGVGGR